MDKIKHGFGPTLLQYHIEDEDFLNYLAEEGIKSQQRINHMLAGVIDDEWLYSKEVIKVIDKRMQPYIIDYINAINQNPLPDTILLPNSMWMNIQRMNDYNPPHNHLGHISFVLYLKMPDEILNEKINLNSYPPGSISFMYNIGSKPFFGDDIFLKNIDAMLAPKVGVSLIPKRGDLLIFPSYLMHYVHGFKSNVERISVAGNYEIINNKRKGLI